MRTFVLILVVGLCFSVPGKSQREGRIGKPDGVRLLNNITGSKK